MRLIHLFHESLQQALFLSLPLLVMNGCFLGCLDIPVLSMLFIIALVAVPVVFFFCLAKVAASNSLYRRVAPLWMSGIVQFIAAGLICALFTAIFLVSNPGFLNSFFHRAIESVYAANGTLPADMPSMEHLDIPSPMEYVGSMFWATSFFGSITSLIFAAILPHITFFNNLTGRFASKRN